jgi:hypothetical protein
MLSLTLVVRLYDTVGVPPQEMAAARHAAAAVLAGAGIDVAWAACAAPARHEACDQKPRSSDLLLRIVRRSPDPASESLADAFVDSGNATGALATVYLQRVHTLAAAAGTDPGTLMGRAIAHEIGHLLFGTTTHGGAGLMRAVWSAAQVRRDQPDTWSFSRAEAARLRARLEARYEAERTERFAGLIEPLPPTKPGCPKAALTCAQSR